MGIERGGLKTWSALAGNKKRPSEYEIVTYKLHYRNRKPDAAYEQSPDSMMNRWYRKHVRDSLLKHDDWDAFRDPDQVTYRSYTAMQDAHEEYVDGLLKNHTDTGHDSKLKSEWVEKLKSHYTPLRYLMTTLQMGSAYIVQMAPASTITNCAAFQEADSFRWLSRTAYRTKQLSLAYPEVGFATSERGAWEDDEAWQGFRELMEKALATYDWAENLFAINVVAARAIDEAIRQLGHTAQANGDTLTAMLCDAQLRDAERSRRWTSAWLKHALGQTGNAEVLAQWKAKWEPLESKALEAYCSSLSGETGAVAAKRAVTHFHSQAGLA
ncbi:MULTISPECIES: toluene monooxygenase [unclassified Caballeronia]|uniref:toluene monooxygenase n=1 Tax=unclassified Caballeronia TaxID=2646786 RepID=UPI001F15B0F3|nr:MULTISPECIES: toluene monooxygenase [unclassified Caballeronia]MCE4547307.1 toluene monooxygenase [Caballeronia sp. PC1]MCE4575290.1 toluene monooxygenase [Caballeronia sp. CLC5]